MEISFVKVHTSKDLLLSALLIAAGVGFFFLNAGLGFVTGLCGLLLLLFYKGGYKVKGKELLLKKKAVDLSSSCRDSLKAFLEGRSTQLSLSSAGNGAVVRLEVYYSSNASKAYVQLFDFSNYSYTPATGIVELQGERAGILIEQIKSL